MNNLINKELKLAVHPTSYIFFLMGFMLLIPNYPYQVAFFYQTLGIFFMFLNGNTNNDVYFTTLLPIRKRDAVKARLITVLLFEVLQIILSIPFAILRNVLIPAENQAGMEANIALFGLAFVMFGLFNIVFLPMFYQTAYKTGLPYVVACSAMVFCVGIEEAAIQLVPGWKAVLDTTQLAFVPQQTIVLVAGIILFALLNGFAYRLSVKRFEKLDL
jgi:hypothetical protein